MQSGSAFTFIFIDCPGQAYAGILLGQEESFFCFLLPVSQRTKSLLFHSKPTFPLFFRYYFEALEEELV